MKQEIKNINLIVLHCTASKETVDYTYDQLEKDHKARGFTGVGYHYFIDKKGIIYRGRQLDEVGAHVAGHNKNSVGISYEGGLDKKNKPKDTRTEEQKEQILNCIFDILKEVRSSGGNVKNIKVVGHRDLSPDKNHDGEITPEEWVKACPCFEAKEEYKDITKLF